MISRSLLQLTSALLYLCLLTSTQLVQARAPYLSAWQSIYPNSTSDDIGSSGCQLCHRDDSGGAPWNAYGWDIRSEYLTNGNDISQAIDTVRFWDHDNDPISAESYDEIIRNFQPGWSAGAVNSVFAINGTETINQLPPSVSLTTALDFPPAVTNPIVNAIPVGAVSLNLNQVASGFNSPLKAVRAPSIDGSLFVVEQTGKVFRVDLATGDKSLFLDVSADLVVLDTNFDERGLLGLAFHPNYASNGLLYTYQSEPVRASQDAEVDFVASSNDSRRHRSMVAEYRASNPSCNSVITKQQDLLIIDQPQFNHNGGDLAFDSNNHLYISLGDGGNRDDQGPGHTLLGNGRDNTNPLGSILRIDPLGANSSNGKYGIPGDNPFTAVGDDGVDEIFAYGLRNPFRISFDAVTDDLFTADVGQDDLEEINVIVNGGNYGWNWLEGSFGFYDPASTGTPYVSDVLPPNLPVDLVAPIAEYDRDEGVSVTGGYVYRGSEISNAVGSYVFGDFSGPNFGTDTGRMFYLDGSNDINEFMMTTPLAGYITGFGQDADNELYVVTNDQFNIQGVDGKLWRLVDPSTSPVFPAADGETAICPPSEDLCFPVSAENGSVVMVCL
ncbi:MAG: glucose/arabinose dehydrogenase [Saprospiraceae bacterium]